MNRAETYIAIAVLASFLSGCDPYRKRKCEWYLEPDLEHRELVQPGWVSLCARNYKSGKQKCYIQASYEFATKIYGKKIKFSEMELSEDEFPKKILKAPACE